MVNVYDADASDVIRLAAQGLKDKIKKPVYVDFVKSGAGKERVPQDADFWYVRSASILRQVYLNGPIGTSRLRTRYGNRKAHTVHRGHHMPAGGSVIRDAFAELEKIEFVKNTKAGRVITPKGRSFMDKVAREASGA
ncbi:MAG: 40S ribosomal protein S19 [Candidatus Micrarchaeaceae archaeon]